MNIYKYYVTISIIFIQLITVPLSLSAHIYSFKTASEILAEYENIKVAHISTVFASVKTGFMHQLQSIASLARLAAAIHTQDSENESEKGPNPYQKALLGCIRGFTRCTVKTATFVPCSYAFLFNAYAQNNYSTHAFWILCFLALFLIKKQHCIQLLARGSIDSSFIVNMYRK